MNRYTYLLLLFLLGAGCSEDSFRQSEGVPVSFSLSGVGTDVSAGNIGTRTENLASGTTVRVVAYKGTTYVADNIYTADASGKLSASSEMRLIEDTYDFYAITPALAIETKSAGGPTFSVEQGTDFAAVKVTQKVTAYSGTSSSSKCGVALGELVRKCAKMTFAIDLAEDVPGTVSKIVITEASLSAMPATQTATGATLNASSGTSVLTLPAAMFVTNAKEPRKASGSTVVLPKTTGAFNLSMKARFNSVTSVTTQFPATGVTMAFENGKHYTFTVRLTKDKLGDAKLGLWLTIAPWTTSDQEIGLGGVPDSGNITTQLLGYWNSVTWDDVSLGGVPTGPIITGVSGWWSNHYDNPHLGSDDSESND